MNNNSNNCGGCGTTCSECGRPWAICKQDGGCGCNKCKDIKFCEYGRMANGCIREKQPGCPMQAVIPSVTVESIEGIKNLADCLVHVSDINTTFYIDDKHRPIITWAGPIDIPGYDMEGNPNNYRDQIVTDVANQMAVIYDKSGKGYLFGLAENIDLQEQVNNKLDEMAQDGTLEGLVAQYIGLVSKNRGVDNIKFIAHQGGLDNAPGNTLVAYEIAGKQGYWGAECDVQKTSDGVYILMHDGTVDATTDGSGNISDFTYAQIQNLTIDAGVDVAHYPSLKVPTLEEYLALCRKINLVPVIELKQETLTANDAEPILNLIRKYGLEDKAIVISNVSAILEAIRNLSAFISIQMVFNSLSSSDIDYCADHHFGVDANQWNETLVNYANSLGVSVNKWTIDNATTWNNFKDLGIEYYTVNSLTYCTFGDSPLFTSVDGINAYSEYEKQSILSGKMLRRAFRNQEFPSSANENTVSLHRGIIPKRIVVEGCAVITYDFSDSKFDGYNITARAFDKNGTQLIDLGWFDHTKSEIASLPKNTAYCVLFCGKGSTGSAITAYDEEVFYEMIRSIVFHNSITTTDSGSEGNFTWSATITRNSDGTQEEVLNLTFTPSYNAWGSLYSYDFYPNLTLPKPFISAPDAVCAEKHSANLGKCWICAPQTTATKLEYLTCVRPSTNSSNVTATVILKGFWK